MQVLAFSDLHGNASALKLLRDNIKGESYDCILVAGDLTNADFVKPDERVRQVKEIFSIMESFRIPYYYVWGIPFREGNLAAALQLIEKLGDYELEEAEDRIILRKKISGHVKIIKIPKTAWQIYREIEHFLSSLGFGKHLKDEEPIKIGEYWLTSSPERIPKGAIFLRHNYREIIPKAVIQIDGHIHYGQHVLNYLNLGFLFRDAFHGASTMIGCYWKLILKGSIVSINFVNLGGELKDFRCPNHPEEGTFYIPRYWKKCPICFEPGEAMVGREK